MRLTFWETTALLFAAIALLFFVMTDVRAADTEPTYGVNVEHHTPYCFKDWSNGTECASYAITVADWLQTRQIRKLEGYSEKNAWICGSQPSEVCTAVWMLTKLGVIAYINHASPDSKFKIHGIPIRLMFNVAYTASHAKAVHNNLRLGLKLEF